MFARCSAMKNTRLCNSILSPSPILGPSLPGPGGMRKIRWMVEGRGKRDGTRVIYYHGVAQAQIWVIPIYRKGIKDDLTPKEKLVLRKINAEW
jgi:hypothetical protein